MEKIRKHSRKRDAILACLRATREHPTAEWIYRHVRPEIPDLSLGTVYRNLSLFVKEGEIQSLGTVAGQERFDGDTSAHAHFVCTRCGAVQDFATERTEPEEADLASAKAQGAVITGMQIQFSGLCADCVKGASKNSGDTLNSVFPA